MNSNLKRRRTQLLMLLLAFTMVFTSFTFLGTQEVNAATTVKYTRTKVDVGEKGWYVIGYSGGYQISQFKANGMTGLCVDAFHNSDASGTATITKLSNSSLTAKVGYYWGYVKGYKSGQANDTKHNQMALEWAMRYAYSIVQNAKGYKTQNLNAFNTWLTAANRSEVLKMVDTAKKQTVPNMYEIYICDPGNYRQVFYVDKLGKATLKLVKKSTTNSQKLGYSFEGIQYTVYESDKKTKVGTFTLDKNGNSKKALTVYKTGTYYAKETKSNDWYELNSKWLSAKVTEPGKAGKFEASDAPVLVPIEVIKVVATPSSFDETFEFVFTNNNYTYSKTIKVKGDGTATAMTKDELPAGTYTVTEKLSNAQKAKWKDITGKQTITIKPTDKKVPVTRKNEEKPQYVGLNVEKSTDDDGPLDGFKFLVTIDLDNAAEITAADIISTVDPQATIKDHPEAYTLGTWTLDESVVTEINAAAKDKKNDTFTAVFTNTATSSDPAFENIDLKVEATINLKDITRDTNNKYVGKIDGVTPASKDDEDYTATFNNFDWLGAGTTAFSKELVTNDKGYGYVAGANEPGLKDLDPGTYTVEEIMTDAQKAIYKQPEKQTKTITAGTTSYTFQFENIAKKSDVKIKKSCEDGNIEGIEFTIKGTTIKGEPFSKAYMTDADGMIDAADIVPGSYVAEETGFDPEKYVNNSPLSGYDNPAKEFTVTGDETDPISLSFVNIPIASIYVAKVDENNTNLAGAQFSLIDAAGNELINFAFQSGAPKMLNAADGIEMDEEYTELDGLNYVHIKGLTAGEAYSLKEVKAPSGYAIINPVDFTGEDGQKLVVENTPVNIGTTATDKDTASHTGLRKEKNTVVDVVEYSGLTPGREYTMEGKLVYKAELQSDVKPVIIDGKEVTASKTFIASKTGSGEVKITFTFDGTKLEQTSVVAFEKARDNEFDVVVGTHEDPTDEDQTVDYPKLGTTLTDNFGRKEVKAKKVTLIDTVEYSGLTPGKKYVMSGQLKIKSTGKDLKNDAGDIYVSDVTFKASETGAGTVKIKFKDVDASKVSDDAIVAFEYCYEYDANADYNRGTRVGQHEDINDEDQTVTVKPSFTPPETGDAAPIYILGAIFVAACGGLAVAVKKRKATIKK